MSIVMKFGGSSVGNSQRIKDVAAIIASKLKQEPKVVVSAVGGITDKLIESANIAVADEDPDEHLSFIEKKHKDILKELELDESLVDHLLKEFKELILDIKSKQEANTETMDKVQSFGERMSSAIVAQYLTKNGTPAKACFAWDIGMITDDEFGNAEPLETSHALIKKKISKIKEVPIITGFIGKTEDGVITTLGRGGSDYTAAIVGAAIGSEEIQIWTDVNGIMSCDPRIVKEARTIPQVSFAEASELAYFGAKVLHPKTIIPAVKNDIPVKVLNTYEPDHPGTVILNKTAKSKEVIKAIASKKNIFVVNIDSTRMLNAHGFLAKIFTVFADYRKVVDMVTTSEVSISLTVDKEEGLDSIAKELSRFAEIKVEKGKAIIGIVGEGMKSSKGISGKIFSALGKDGINIEMISQGASEVNVCLVVDEKDREKAVKVLHKEIFG